MYCLDADASQPCDLPVAHAVLAHGLDVTLRPLRGDERVLGLDELVEVAGASLEISGVDEERVRSARAVAPYVFESCSRLVPIVTAISNMGRPAAIVQDANV